MNAWDVPGLKQVSGPVDLLEKLPVVLHVWQQTHLLRHVNTQLEKYLQYFGL